MKEEKAIKLIKQYQQDALTPEQELRLHMWYLINTAESKAEMSPAQMEQTIELLRSKLPLDITARKMKLWPGIGIAAAVAAIVMSFAIWFLQPVLLQEGASTALYATDIAPGKQGATLTLANGKKIKLGDVLNGELAKEDGVAISKTADGQLVYKMENQAKETGKINTLSTARGETYLILLPDGTKITLNAESSIRYPSNFNALTKRSVELTGEAYFIVKHNAKQPFQVQSRGQLVEDIGTAFNINSYHDEPVVKTTLVEGAAKVTALTAGQSTQNSGVLLTPNQQAILRNAELTVKAVDAADVVAWKNGLFIFEDEPLQEIMRKIARWYGVTIHYEDIDLNKKFGGSVSRYENVSKVLRKLELTGRVHFKIEGRSITVMK